MRLRPHRYARRVRLAAFGIGVAVVTLGALLMATLPGSPAAAATTAVPTNTGEPSISGIPRVGQVLRTTRGTWTSDTAIAYTYQWRRCNGRGLPDASNCTRITNAIKASYVVRPADVGFRIRSRVTATNADGSASAASNPTAVVTSAKPTNTDAPSISGSAVVGSQLTASRGTWVGDQPITYAFQWLRCSSSGDNCSEINGANDNQYVLQDNDVGRTLRVRVTATNDAGRTVAISNPTNLVRANTAPLTNTARPTITGTARVGEQLSADMGTWNDNPTSFTYQWQRCDVDAVTCIDIPGATGQTYGIRSLDVGFRMRVTVTAHKNARTGTAMSSPTAVVQPVTPVTNKRPTLRILGSRFLGARIYVRMRICDDQARNLAILVRESRPGVRPALRRFATRVPPRPCGAYTRSWLLAQRFRGPGRYTITLRARDISGFTSFAVRRTFHRG